MPILKKMIKSSLIFIIGGLRPILGPAECKFPIGCTDFAISQLQSEPFFKAIWAIFKRVLACNPFNKSILT